MIKQSAIGLNSRSEAKNKYKLVLSGYLPQEHTMYPHMIIHLNELNKQLKTNE